MHAAITFIAPYFWNINISFIIKLIYNTYLYTSTSIFLPKNFILPTEKPCPNHQKPLVTLNLQASN